MRFLPRLKVIQSNLDLSIINVDRALEKLINEKFSGYVSFLFSEKREALIVLKNGAIDNHFYCDPDTIIQGKDAQLEIEACMQKAEGTVDIVSLNERAFECLLSLLQGKSKFGTLHSDYVLFEGFMAYIETEKLDGCLAIQGKDDDVLLYCEEGIPKSLYFRGRNIRKGTKAEVARLVKDNSVTIDFLQQMKQDNKKVREARQKLVEAKKETLFLQKVVSGDQAWFEDQYGNRYKKSKIGELWEKYNIVL